MIELTQSQRGFEGLSFESPSEDLRIRSQRRKKVSVGRGGTISRRELNHRWQIDDRAAKRRSSTHRLTGLVLLLGKLSPSGMKWGGVLWGGGLDRAPLSRSA